MEIKSNSIQNIGCTENDVRNFEQHLRDKHRDIDVESLVEFFSMEKEKKYFILLWLWTWMSK